MELRFAKLVCVALRLKTVEGVGTVQCVGILRCAQNDGLWPFGRALRDAQVSFANLGHPVAWLLRRFVFLCVVGS